MSLDDLPPELREIVEELEASGGQSAGDAEDAKVQIARKISRLVPELSEETQKALLDNVLHILQVLAQDQLTRVRAIIAEELKDSDRLPHDIACSLAKDEDIHVSSLILEFSPMLTDADLLEVIAESDIPEVTEAIAKRSQVSTDVSNAIAESNNIAAISILLGNEGAEISSATLDVIAHQANDNEELQGALLKRPELSQRTLNHIASFVTTAVIDQVIQSEGLDSDTGSQLSREIRTRLRDLRAEREIKARQDVEALEKAGKLSPEIVAHFVDKGETAFVAIALTRMSGLPEKEVVSLLHSSRPKAVVSLCWKAGLSMRQAMQVQLRLAHISPHRILNAKDGTDYPFPTKEMQEYLDLFGE